MQQSTLGRGRPKDPKKRQAILEAAKTTFLTLGYDGTSMDSIAQQAGVSKLTVYSHFHDKEQLFSSAIEMVCEQRLPRHFYDLETTNSAEPTAIREKLFALGCAFLNMIYSEEAKKLHLLMSSMVTQQPNVVQLFFKAGPLRTFENFVQFFERARQLSLLQLDDAKQTAEIFSALLTDCHYDQVLWGIEPMPTLEHIEQMVAQRMSIFLKVYPPIDTTRS